MSERLCRRALQLCPNDKLAFTEICRNHARALTRLGYEVATIFFASGDSASLKSEWHNAGTVEFLGHARLKRKNRLIRDQIVERLHGRSFELLIGHRFRGLQVALALNRTETTNADPGARTILGMVHEYGFLRHRRRRRILARLSKASSRANIFLAGVSGPVVQELKALCKLTCLEIPNVLDIEQHDHERIDRESARKALGIGSEYPLIGYVGRLEAIKNPLPLLQSFRAVLQDLPRNSKLVYIGAGSEESTLKAAVQAQNLRARVHFTGYLPQAHRLLSALDVLVVPADAREAFGMVLIEAMLARVPVICADSQGPRQVLSGHGHLFDLQDPGSLARNLRALLQVGETDERVRELQRAREHVIENHALSTLVARYQEVLELSGCGTRVDRELSTQ